MIVGLLGACAWFSLYLITFLMWQIPPKPDTYAIELADLDGDGDLDAFLANGRNERPEPNTVLWNDGQGTFQDSGQRLGNFESSALAFGGTGVDQRLGRQGRQRQYDRNTSERSHCPVPFDDGK